MKPARERILIVSVNWLGDLLFMTPAIRAIRRAYPESHIGCLVPKRGLDLLSANPHLDEMIPFEESRGVAGFFRWLGLIGRLKSKRFDTAYLFHRSFTRAFVVAMAGIPHRIGPGTRKQSRLLTQSARMPSKDSMHKAAWYLKILEADEIFPDGLQYDLALLDEDQTAADKVLTGLGLRPGEKFVAIHPGANWEPKRWPAENFARVADLLREKRGIRAVFVGGPGDLDLVRKIRSFMKSEPAVATGKTSLRETAALVKRAAALVSNDSGPLHIGAAVGTAVIGLFGPTDPALSGPPSGTKGVLICGLGSMENIKVDQVLAAVEQYL